VQATAWLANVGSHQLIEGVNHGYILQSENEPKRATHARRALRKATNLNGGAHHDDSQRERVLTLRSASAAGARFALKASYRTGSDGGLLVLAQVARADAMRISKVTKRRMVDVSIVSVAWSVILFGMFVVNYPHSRVRLAYRLWHPWRY
jgi:hypothetical protein